jgi:hypothetical protein
MTLVITLWTGLLQNVGNDAITASLNRASVNAAKTPVVSKHTPHVSLVGCGSKQCEQCCLVNENIGLQIARLFVGQSPSVLSATLSAEFQSSIVSCRKAEANGVIDLLGQYFRAFCVVDTFHGFS